MTMTAVEMKAQLEQERQARAEACMAAVQAILKERNCQLVAAPQVTAEGRIVAVVQIVAAE